MSSIGMMKLMQMIISAIWKISRWEGEHDGE